MAKLSEIVTPIVVVGLLGLGLYPIIKTVSADGKIEYCYVNTDRHPVVNQPDVVIYSLWGFRPWRSDRRISPNLKNLEEVKTAAETYGCTLR